MGRQKGIEIEGRRAPKGHFVVYVGNELRRHIVPLSVLKNPIFVQLLEKAAEEYGFDCRKSITILPCDESTFLGIIHAHALS